MRWWKAVTDKKKDMVTYKQVTEFFEEVVLNEGRTDVQNHVGFMNIHNNTVQYRLKKANEILGAEMTANRVIPGLTMALALKRLEED